MKSKRFKPQGFTLIEVMVSGVLIIVTFTLITTLFARGIAQQQTRQQERWLHSQVDAWQQNFRLVDFEASDLAIGSYQQNITSPSNQNYTLDWQITSLHPQLKQIDFQLREASAPSRVIQQWTWLRRQ